MKKAMKLVAVACVCAFTALAIWGCGSPAPSSSSASSSASSEAIEVKEAIKTDPVYVLVNGNDSRYGTSEQEKDGATADSPSFADTIMLMRLDPANNRIAICTIPRDTAAEVNGNPDKINATHWMGGPEALAKEVGGMFGVDVPYYFDMRFIDFTNFVDQIGGINVNVPMGLTGGDIVNGEEITLSEGPNTLNGTAALMLARQRKVYAADGEAVRQMISRDMVANTIQAFAAKPASEAATYAKMLESDCKTNMPEDVLEAYMAAFMNNDTITFNLGTTPYTGGIDESGTWRISRDANVYAQLKQAMETGGDLTAVVPLPAVS